MSQPSLFPEPEKLQKLGHADLNYKNASSIITKATILTRTRSILIIAMFDETIPRYREIVKLFPQDRLMIWDEETQQHYNDKIMSLPSVVASAGANQIVA